jgi:hypothetical protein
MYVEVYVDVDGSDKIISIARTTICMLEKILLKFLSLEFHVEIQRARCSLNT